VHASLFEQLRHDRPERLGRQTPALARLRQRDPELGGRRLAGHDPHGAIPAQRARLPFDDRQLQPLAGSAELQITL
jgi:hypothetical protein